jgi:hypothetical protein
MFALGVSMTPFAQRLTREFGLVTGGYPSRHPPPNALNRATRSVAACVCVRA